MELNQIQKCVADWYGISVEKLLSPVREPTIREAQLIAMYIARMDTTKSLPAISQAFNRTRGGVINAVRTVAKRLENEPQIAKIVETIRRQLGEVS